jgi:tetratricopeptide (TPR) repeat protein
MVLIVLVAIMPLTFFGQNKANQAKSEKKSSSFSPYWYVLGDLGVATHHGDLAQYGFAFDPKFIKLNGHLGGGYQFGGVLGANAKFGRGYLGGEKDGLNAILDYNDYFEGNLNLTINMVNLLFGTDEDRFFSVSPHFGVGQVHWKAKAINQTTSAVINTVGMNGSSGGANGDGGNENGLIGDRRLALTVPVGLDLGFNVNPKWDLYMDYTFNFVDSDLLDAYGYGTKMMKKDMYSNLNIGARYKFGASGAKKMAKNFDQVLVEASPSVMVEKGDSVVVTVRGTIPPKYFDKKSAMNITPVIVYEGGSTALEPISLKGESAIGDGQVISYKNGGTFTHTATVPYNPGMNVSELVFSPIIYTPKTETLATREAIQESGQYFTADQRKLADGVIYTSKRLAEDEMVTSATAHGYEKVTMFAKNADLYFKVNQADLDLKLPLNKKDENKALLQGMSSEIQKGWNIKDITIAGWASPEGEETFNAGLSERRANTTEKYVKEQLNKLAKDKNAKVSYAKADDITFTKSGNGPDWNGFMNAVEGSSIKDKNAILNVVRSANAASREQEIRNMILIYPELEKEILPPLRRAIISVNTFEPKRTDSEISSLAISSPETLSLAELLYAATLTADPATQKTILGNTMRLHPSCLNAVINASDAEMALGNYDAAKSLLEKALTMSDKSAEVYNNLGIIAVHNKDYVAAESHFAKAKQLGADVSYNEGIVSIYKGDYANAVNAMKSKKCDYNLGLAQTLNGDLAGAKATLDCAPVTGHSLYLKAIIGARSNDKEMLYSNLMKAIQKDEDYKNQAKWDREFINFFNEQDFMNIVK